MPHAPDTFPQVPFLPSGDERGGGGGGGAGGLSILAVGPIIVEQGGRIFANGGHGGAGESVAFFDRVAGAGGGGSGGHIVLSSASYIEIKGVAENAGDGYRDGQSGHQLRPISALGGQGGAGHDNRGGADPDGPSSWRCDAIPIERVSAGPGGEAVPPLLNPAVCFGPSGMPDWDDPLGPVLGAGGDGSPGIIQLHVKDAPLNLRFTGVSPSLAYPDIDVTKAIAPAPLGWNGIGETPDKFIPFFGPISGAQSVWIPLGLARVAPGPLPDDQVRFQEIGSAAFGLLRPLVAEPRVIPRSSH